MTTAEPTPPGPEPASGATGEAAATPRSDGTGAMVAGALVSALGTYLFQLIGGRALGDEEFAPIAILWTLQFLGFTILYTPIEQLIIRRLTLSAGRAEALRRAAALIAGIIAFGVAAAVAYVWWNLDEIFLGKPAFILTTAVLFVGLGIYAIGRGFLAGRERFREYGIVVGAESLTRLILTVAVIVVVATAVAVSWAMALAPFVILAARPWRNGAGHSTTVPRDDQYSAGRFLSGLLVATTASQAILAGGALVVQAIGATASEVSIFFVTFTLFRGPLTASYNLLARVLQWFTAQAAEGEDLRLRRRSIQVGFAGMALAVVGGLAGGLLGPDIVSLFFGSEFRPEPELAALAAAGVVLGATALFIGQLLVARGATAVLGALWVGALIIATIVVVVVDGTASIRVGWGFVIGELWALLSTMGVIWRGSAEPRDA